MTYLDTEPWRGEPLLAYLKKMVFWSDVQPAAADLAVLSLIGPRLQDPDVLAALGLKQLPDPSTAVALQPPGAGFLRRIPTPPGQIELDLLVPRDDVEPWLGRLDSAGVRRAGIWAYEAHRVAARRPRLGVDTDERTIPHEVHWIGPPGQGAVHLDKGCYRGQETVARVHNLGRPPRMLVLVHLDGSGERPATGDALLADGRTVGRLGTVVDHVDLGPIALALVKRGIPAGTALTTGGEHPRGGRDRPGFAARSRHHRCRSNRGRTPPRRRNPMTVAGYSPLGERACRHFAAAHGKVSAGHIKN